MSIPVSVEALAAAIADQAPVCYLLTTSDDGRPHATHASVEVADGTVRCGIGRRTAVNLTTRPKVSLLWPPAEPGGYSLIADGDATVSGTPGDDAAATITISNAILHRPAADPTAPAPGDACAADCAPVGETTTEERP